MAHRLGSVEGREEPVARGLDDRPAGVLDRRPQERIVGIECDRHRRPLLLPQPRAALDVGHEEGGGPGRLGCTHHQLVVGPIAGIVPAARPIVKTDA